MEANVEVKGLGSGAQATGQKCHSSELLSWRDSSSHSLEG